jgi:hypothetical protein
LQKARQSQINLDLKSRIGSGLPRRKPVATVFVLLPYRNLNWYIQVIRWWTAGDGKRPSGEARVELREAC